MYKYIYLLIIGIVAGIIFIMDKEKAKKKKQRISERVLHILEFAGGVFSILPLMYFIRHKNRKMSYFWITYSALFVWFLIWFFLF